jgi:hypothetical protein
LSRKARSEVKEQKRLITGFLVLILPILLAWKISPASPRRTEAQGMPAPTGTPLPPLAAESLAYVPETAWRFPDYPRLEAMRGNITHTFQLCELEFTGSEGDATLGLMPSPEYPILFARDTATMLAAARYFYPDERLRTPIEEFLHRQYRPETASDEDAYAAGEGAISAVIAPDGHVDKATAVSDEETSLIHAAYLYYRTIGGGEWLRKEIAGRQAIVRLNSALDWLYAHRFEKTYSLIKRGHTTDWGDVKMEPTEGNPTDMDPQADHWTCSLFDQALTYRALLELAEMNEATGDRARADLLRQRAADLRAGANRYLWQPGRGFYRTHLHLTPLRHPFNEDEMVSIANAVAVYCGLADENQARAIFRKLERARTAAGAAKPGLTLYPPYPDGTFAAPYMRAGCYQNGGLWDWWGGVQISAEFASGYSYLALAHLLQVADDWAQHPDKIHEWQEPTSGRGHGPANYASAAGTMGEAVIGGLYGVALERQSLTLTPRLGRHLGYIRAYQPATDHYVAYNYTYSGRAIILDYGTNHPGPLTIRVLLPGQAGEVERAEIDGEETPFTMKRRGDDVYCVLSTPVGMHRLALIFRL